MMESTGGGQPTESRKESLLIAIQELLSNLHLGPDAHLLAPLVLGGRLVVGGNKGPGREPAFAGPATGYLAK